MRSKWAAGKAVRAGLAEEGAYLNRYVTDEQGSRRPIFIATLWAGASWLFFRVAHSTRMTQIWALRSRLDKQPTDLRQNTSYFGDRTLALGSGGSIASSSGLALAISGAGFDISAGGNQTIQDLTGVAGSTINLV